MKRRQFYPPKGITCEAVARAYAEAGSIEGAAELLGCSPNTVEHHIHRAGVKVARWAGAFKHVRTPKGIMRVRLRPDEQPKDTVPPPILKRGRAAAISPLRTV